MAQNAQDRTETRTDSNVIAFEQPLNERMRTFLRIELLNQQALFHSGIGSDFGTRAAVASLLEILSITGRGDVRSDVLKEIDRHAERLVQYRRTAGVDRARLEALMGKLEQLRDRLSHAGKQFMAGLRESEFLSSIRHRSAIPGGTCMFDLPEYGYWLSLSDAERGLQLGQWLAQLEPLCDAIAEVLWMTREGSVATEHTARDGLFHHTLSKEEHYDLLRVLMDRRTGLYPEISAGQHRFTLRFAEWQGVDQRPKHTQADVRFQLALC